MLEQDFLDLCPHTVTLEPLSTMDVYAKPVYGTGVSYQALVVYMNKLVAGGDNMEVTSRTQVYIPSSSATASEQSRITLDDGTQPRIIRVDRYSDDDGQHNLTIFCG
jgi:hypothetical protein